MNKQIELKFGEIKALYHSETRIVTHFTRNGVCMECEMPKEWSLTRIFQFMDTLLKASKTIV